MRAYAVAAALALAGLTGCGDDRAAPAPSPPTALSASGQAACRDAATTQRLRWAAFDGRWSEVERALRAGDETGSAAAGEIASQELFEWSSELRSLERRAGDPGVAAALRQSADQLAALGAPEDQTPVDEMRARVRAAAEPTAAACGATPPPS